MQKKKPGWGGRARADCRSGVPVVPPSRLGPGTLKDIHSPGGVHPVTEGDRCPARDVLPRNELRVTLTVSRNSGIFRGVVRPRDYFPSEGRSSIDYLHRCL